MSPAFTALHIHHQNAQGRAAAVTSGQVSVSAASAHAPPIKTNTSVATSAEVFMSRHLTGPPSCLSTDHSLLTTQRSPHDALLAGNHLRERLVGGGGDADLAGGNGGG